MNTDVSQTAFLNLLQAEKRFHKTARRYIQEQPGEEVSASNFEMFHQANESEMRWIARLEATAAMNESRATGIQLIIWKIYSFFKMEK